MITLLSYLISIRFRKFISKGDYIAMSLIIGLYIGVALVCYFNYEVVRGTYYIVFLDAILYHLGRTDVELLKVYKHYRFVLWLEYMIYSIPFLTVLALKREFIGLSVVIVIYYLLSYIPKKQSIVIKVPFSLVNPFWHISFRKYKLLWILPIVILFSVMGIKYNNGNLVIASFVLVGMIASIATFERERIIEIKVSTLSAKEYIEKQVKTEMWNTLTLILPVLVLVNVLSFDWNYVFLGSLILAIPMCNVILKYAFYESVFKQQLFIGGCFLGLGLPLLAIPFLYKRAIRQLNQIKDVENTY
ncbi:hypothetical protein LNQ81_02230 [Myroides sp. M-43]|uniref:hypothetical protein n=1 Tax=Myroides oncorhynchi TaxID=2893756 RepID=UPI001E394F23|nr:hypothetical protein [Myroides oncorhynchi]MCC9041534.1 hypothetical protein [Myroides oncorhynchi]